MNLQNGQECGGAYLKLLSDSPDLNPAGFRDQTPYTIMFGPDKCGNDNKVCSPRRPGVLTLPNGCQVPVAAGWYW